MATTTPSTPLIPVAPVFTSTERLALAGFLAGYTGLTRQAYELDLRQFASWCQQRHLHLFQARRADIELFARDLEGRSRARGHHHSPPVHCRRVLPVCRRGGVARSLTPAHVRRPRLGDRPGHRRKAPKRPLAEPAQRRSRGWRVIMSASWASVVCG